MEHEYHDKLSMVDREEMLRINSLLSKNKLTADVSVSGIEAKKGGTISTNDLEQMNRFAINTLVRSFDAKVQAEYEKIKTHFRKQKEKLKADFDEKVSILEKDDILPSGVVKLVKVATYFYDTALIKMCYIFVFYIRNISRYLFNTVFKLSCFNFFSYI